MYYFLAAFFCFYLSLNTFSQQVAIGESLATPRASAMLDLQSTSKGFLAPRMTSAQRNAIASPATGLLVYVTDGTSGFYRFDGSQWTSSFSDESKGYTVNIPLYESMTAGTTFGRRNAFVVPPYLNGKKLKKIAFGSRIVNSGFYLRASAYRQVAGGIDNLAVLGLGSVSFISSSANQYLSAETTLAGTIVSTGDMIYFEVGTNSGSSSVLGGSIALTFFEY